MVVIYGFLSHIINIYEFRMHISSVIVLMFFTLYI
jgi:hypothetical protein